MQKSKLQITEVKDDGFQMEIREEREMGTQNETKTKHKAQEEGSREKTPPAEERRQSWPAPEKTIMPQGHRGGKGLGRRPFSEVKIVTEV